jgi:hypothetical protein
MNLEITPVFEQSLVSHSTTQVEIKLEEWSNNIFSLWLPENMYVGPDALWNMRDDRTSYQEYELADEYKLSWVHEVRGYTIIAQITAEQYYIVIEVRVHNKTGKVSLPLYTHIPMYFNKAIEFSDPDFERTWIRRRGRWRKLSTIQTDKQSTQIRKEQAYDNTKDQGDQSKSLDKPGFSTDSSVIIRESRDGKRSIAMVSADSIGVYADRIDGFWGIESVQAPFFRFLPGQWVLIRHRIYFHEGNHSALMQQYGYEIKKYVDSSPMRW